MINNAKREYKQAKWNEKWAWRIAGGLMGVGLAA